jgi:copper chaperone
MTEFDVQDMTCGHCVATITKTVKALDPQAEVMIDLPAHRVSISATQLGAEQWRAALEDAGYTPVLQPS